MPLDRKFSHAPVRQIASHQKLAIRVFLFRLPGIYGTKRPFLWYWINPIFIALLIKPPGERAG